MEEVILEKDANGAYTIPTHPTPTRTQTKIVKQKRTYRKQNELMSVNLKQLANKNLTAKITLDKSYIMPALLGTLAISLGGYFFNKHLNKMVR